ncbi:MAG: PAS-domain containing protein [Roseobacter sp.]|uniref:hybrid sensor histidine kinase/response regulator n=1 Tax=Tateyamaria sp. TaxID=1929288 RepID=UPI003290635B
MRSQLLRPDDTLERQSDKLLQICEVLMNRLEYESDQSGRNLAQFEHAAILEEQQKQHNSKLQAVLRKLNHTNIDLEAAKQKVELTKRDLSEAIEAFSQGFGLFDHNDILVMKNSRFCENFPDVKDSIDAGMNVTDFIDILSTSHYFHALHPKRRATWARKRKQDYAKQNLTRTFQLSADRWIRINQHKTSSRSTVILQTDVTDIVKLQALERDKLVDSQVQLIHATLDHLSDGICIFDSDLRLVGWNQRLIRILGGDETDFRVGTNFDTLYGRVRPDFDKGNDRWAKEIRSWVLNENKRHPLKLEVQGDAGQVYYVNGRSMPDEGLLISLRDITAERTVSKNLVRNNEILEHRVEERTIELEIALKDAKTANASKTRFVAAASHDVLQPLSAAKLFLDSLEKATLSRQTQLVLNKTQDALQSVESILEALLDISKLESDRETLDVGSIELGPLLNRMRNEFAPKAAAKNLKFSLVQCMGHVITDAGLFQRILRNLISNAIRYTDSGKILVGARRDSSNLRIEVHDTGRGIPTDQQTKVFSEFYRLDTAASAAEGMGLGLAIVERACQRLGHPLGMESEVGKGTKFHFTVPISDTALDNESTQRKGGGTPKLTPGLVVLLVENDAQLRPAISLFLKKWKVGVIEACCADEAHELLDELQFVPDAFLIDYKLDNKTSGLDLALNLRTRFGVIPTCIMSANRSEELVAQCLAAELDLIHKPIEPSVFQSFLSSAWEAQALAGR